VILKSPASGMAPQAEIPFSLGTTSSALFRVSIRINRRFPC
ncbi:unnamed protein product, partial [marine sediment metagenome]